MNNRHMQSRGFTLLEILVAIAIIGILASVMLASFNTAQEKTQDTRRITELDQLKKALELYHIDHGHYPRESEGANGRIGEGAGVDEMLAPYMTKIPADPAGPGHANYYYYYDGRATCGGSDDIVVIFAYNMAQQTGNASKLPCTVWGGEGGSGTANAYHIIVGLSD